jgi:hypothetical protein
VEFWSIAMAQRTPPVFVVDAGQLWMVGLDWWVLYPTMYLAALRFAGANHFDTGKRYSSATCLHLDRVSGYRR